MGPQHSQSLESWFMHIPGIKIAMPSNAADAYGLLRTALLDRNPVLFVENVRLYGRRAERRPGRGDPVRPGADRPRGHRRHGRRALGHGRRGARGRRAARRARHLGRGHRSAHARAARHGHDPPRRSQDDAARRRPRRAPDARRSAPRSRRAAWRRRSTTSTLPSSASPALDVPIPCTPSGIEAVYPSAERRGRRGRAPRRMTARRSCRSSPSRWRRRR